MGAGTGASRRRRRASRRCARVRGARRLSVGIRVGVAVGSHRDVLAVHGPMPGSSSSCSRASPPGSRRRPPASASASVAIARCRCAASGSEPAASAIAAVSGHSWVRPDGLVERPLRRRPPAGRPAWGGGERDLLPEHGADRELAAVGRAGHASPGLASISGPRCGSRPSGRRRRGSAPTSGGRRSRGRALIARVGEHRAVHADHARPCVSRTVRRYPPPATSSIPGTARAARNASRGGAAAGAIALGAGFAAVA